VWVLTVLNGSMEFKVQSLKPYNYGNESTGVLVINGVGTLTATCIAGQTEKTSLSTLTVPPGTYTYTLTAEIEIFGGITSGAAVTNILTV
jgi:hypothetical protein